MNGKKDIYAFPFTSDTYTADAGLTMRDYFAAHAPEPSLEDIGAQMQRDKNINPHNDSYKPALRSRLEIIADLKFAYADAMLAARNK